MAFQQHLQLPPEGDPERVRAEGLLRGLGQSLDRKFHDYKTARADKDAEWERAIKQYEGHWDAQDQDKIKEVLEGRGSSANDLIKVNITRPKTNIAIARMKDIQFPTGGDYNFYIRPANFTPEQVQAQQATGPDPSMQMEAANAGMPAEMIPQPADMVADIDKDNIERAPAMERKLRERIIAADYGRKARLAIEDMCIKGTAIIKGPTLQDKKYRSYSSAQTSDQRTVQLLEERYEQEPTTERVDPLYVFPDPSARLPDEIEDIFELHPMSVSELIELAKNPSFIKEMIREALKSEPSVTDVPEIVCTTYQAKDGKKISNRYWVREYHGPLDKDVLFNADMISLDEKEDPLKRYTGEVWVCNGQVIRISLSHIEGEDQLPYGLAVWEKDPNSVFGHGVPYLLRDAQRTVNSAYLLLLDNASLTSGPQIVLNKDMIEPAEGSDYALAPMKAWFMTGFGTNVNDAMQFVNIPAQMEGIAQIIDMAMQFADVESSTPLIMQGETPTGNNTTTGMAMIMSATNFIQKAASMNWDDYITRPMMMRYYHHEMQHGEDDSIKGDFTIEVGGATERIEAQIRAQEIERLLSLAGSNEQFMLHVDIDKAFRALTDNTRTGDILHTMAEVEAKMAEMQAAAQQEQQQNPDMLRAQASMITAQAKQQEAAASAQLNNARQQMAAQEMQANYQSRLAEAQARQNQATLEFQAALMKISAEQQISTDKLMAQLKMKDIEYAMQLDLKEIDFTKFEREIEVKEAYGTGI